MPRVQSVAENLIPHSLKNTNVIDERINHCNFGLLKKHVYLYFITISQLTFNMHIHLIEKLSLS